MSQPAGNAEVQPATLRLCPACDYDLRGIQSDRCPECGLLIENAPPLTIPWEHRRQMGRFRAFWRTAHLAALRKRFSQAVAGPVDDSAAKRFRFVVSLIASIPAAVILIVVVWHAGIGSFVTSPSGFSLLNSMDQGSLAWEFMMMWGAGATLTPILPFGMIVSVWLATGSARVWFAARRLDPQRRQRAAAISAYACAPLVLQPIAAVAAAGLLVIDPEQTFPAGPVWGLTVFLYCVFGIAEILSIVGWWFGTLQLLSRTTRCGWGRLICAAIGQPVGWAVSVVIGLAVWPCLAGLIWIAIDSFRK